jgi:hypothetical protein
MLKTRSVAAALAASFVLSGPALAVTLQTSDGALIPDYRVPAESIQTPESAGQSPVRSPLLLIDSTIGDVVLNPDPDRLLSVTNALPEDDAAPLNVSTNAPVAVGAVGGLEQTLGLSIGSLDGRPGEWDYAMEGSAQAFAFSAVSEGLRLAFDWRFASVDTVNPDFAFYVLDGVINPLADALSATFLSGDTPFGRDTGWLTLTTGPLASGNHTLAFGVVDVNDFVASSALDVRNLTLLPVPEADSRWLLACGLLALAGGRFARQRATRRGH